MNCKLNPNHGMCILKPVEEGEGKVGNIIIPNIDEKNAMMATIEAIAPIYNFHSDSFVESRFKVGDIVFFPAMGSTKVKEDGETYIICGIQDLLASITK